MQPTVVARRPLLSWVVMSVAARALSAALGIGWSWLFILIWGEPTRPLTAFIQLGTMIALGIARGIFTGLLTGQVLGQILPEANLQLYVRNIALMAGLELTLVALPIAWMWLEPGTSYASAFSGDHTLAMALFVLLIGPAEWWSFRQYRKSQGYIFARAFSALLAIGLEQLLQSTLFSVGIDSAVALAGRLLGACLIGALVALPTGVALLRIARANPQPLLDA